MCFCAITLSGQCFSLDISIVLNWYRFISKNSGIESALFLLHTVLLLGTVFYVNIILQRKYRVSGIDRYQTKHWYRTMH